MEKPTCDIPSCESDNIAARGICWKHYAQIRRYGEVREVGPINYKAAHMRIRKERGRARDHQCVDCGGTAAQWSYNGGSEDELSGDSNGFPVVFSPNPSDYSPRCRQCHVNFDQPDIVSAIG